MTRPERLIDAGFIIALQRVSHLDALQGLSARFSLVMVEEAYDEVTEPRSGKHATEARQAAIALEAVSVQSIDPESQAAARLHALRTRRAKVTRADLGEDASIAWAADHPTFVFVTRDRGAAFLALNELRGRTMTLFHFLREAVEVGALEPARARAMADAISTTKGVSAVPPLWWQGWLDER